MKLPGGHLADTCPSSFMSVGRDDPAVRVRGDAVVVKLAGRADHVGFEIFTPPRPADFTAKEYENNYGIFGYFKLPAPPGQEQDMAYGSLLPNTEEGERTNIVMMQMIMSMVKGEAPPTDDELDQMMTGQGARGGGGGNHRARRRGQS